MQELGHSPGSRQSTKVDGSRVNLPSLWGGDSFEPGKWGEKSLSIFRNRTNHLAAVRYSFEKKYGISALHLIHRLHIAPYLSVDQPAPSIFRFYPGLTAAAGPFPVFGRVLLWGW